MRGWGAEGSRPPLICLSHIGREYGTEELFAKLEYTSPTRNHKYRFAETALAQFSSGAWTGISVASCGHLGSSLAHLCAQRSIRCQIFVPRGCPILVTESPVVSVDSSSVSYEAAVDASKAFAKRHSMLEATPGAHLASAYRDTAALVAEEILLQSDRLPEMVICPVGNGTTLAGIYHGFLRNTCPVPRHVGVSIASNALTGSDRNSYPFDWDLEPLRSTDPLDADTARQAIDQSGGEFVCVSPENIHDAAEHLRLHEGLSVHPAAAASLAGWQAVVGRMPSIARKRAILILTAQR
jgi:threonine synthase